MLAFNEAKHEYSHGDRVVPSVTQILKEVGIIDDRFFTDDARERGSAVHKTIEAYIKYGDEGCHPLLAGYLGAYRRFEAELRPEIIESESLLFYSQGGIHYAGTGDIFCILDHQLTYLDFKTGGKDKWHALQTAAYSEAYWQQSGRPVLRRGSLYLEGDGTYRLNFHDNQTDAAVFLAAAAIVNWKRQ
jgi:hypothetical protein